MAKNNNGSPFEWLARPLWELARWIQANNRLVEKEDRRREEARARTSRGGRKFGRR